jgi:hypothetical protein
MDINSGTKDTIRTGGNAAAQSRAIHAKTEALKGKTETKSPINYYKKNVYGNEHNYIHEPHVAEAHRKLTGQTTLSERHMEAYKALGHEVNHVPKN